MEFDLSKSELVIEFTGGGIIYAQKNCDLVKKISEILEWDNFKRIKSIIEFSESERKLSEWSKINIDFLNEKIEENLRQQGELLEQEIAGLCAVHEDYFNNLI